MVYTNRIYIFETRQTLAIYQPLLKMNNALYNPRNPVTHQPYRIPFNMVVYTFIIASIGIIVYLVVKCIIDLTMKNTVLQKHNTEINEQIELLKKHTMEMDERITLLHKIDEKNNEQIELLKPQITELNIHNDEMSIRYETAIQELSELVGLFVVENDISAKIQTTVSNIMKYFEFFDKLSEHLGEERYRDMFIHKLPTSLMFEEINGNSTLYATRASYILHSHRFRGHNEFNPFTHTPILMKHFSKYYNETNDMFYPLRQKAYGKNDTDTQIVGNRMMNYREYNLSPGQVFNPNSGEYCQPANIVGNLREHRALALLNRGIIQLLHETDQDFELKILENILIELEDIYVFYKQCEILGLKEVVKLPF